MKNLKNLLFENRKDYFLIKINRPKNLNALNQKTIEELILLFDFITKNSVGKYGIVITGEGDKSFVAGADIKEFVELDSKSSLKFCRNGHDLFNKIEKMHIPVIALVNGYALGGGCELSLACHIRVATVNAKFSQPEINLGLIPGYGGTQRLTQIVGKSKALEMMLTTEMISAEDALKYNLINNIVEDIDSGIKKVEEYISIFKRKGPNAVKNVIKSVNNYFDKDIDGFEDEIKLFIECVKTSDFKEGIQAFIEKRCPDFKGE